MLSKYEKRLSVSQSIDFNLTTNELWNLISAPGNLNSSHPFCKINEIISWEKGDYSDRLVYLNVETMSEIFNLGKKAKVTPY